MQTREKNHGFENVFWVQKKSKSSELTPVFSILKQDIAASVCTCSNPKNDEKRKPRVSSKKPGIQGFLRVLAVQVYIYNTI